MSGSYSSNIKSAGDYLTRLLLDKITLKYNEHFYRDGVEALDAELQTKFGMDPRDDLSPAIYVDLAVFQLKQAGFVATSELPERMGDGEPDYEIEVTEEYLQFIEHGNEFEFRYVDQ